MSKRKFSYSDTLAVKHESYKSYDKIYEIVHRTVHLITLEIMDGSNICNGANLKLPVETYIQIKVMDTPHDMKRTRTVLSEGSPVWKEKCTFFVPIKLNPIVEFHIMNPTEMGPTNLGTYYLQMRDIQVVDCLPLSFKYKQGARVNILYSRKRDEIPDLWIANDISLTEKVFYRKRRQIIFNTIRRMLPESKRPASIEKTPIIGIVASAGGIRASIALAAVIEALQELKLFQLIMYISSQDGSSWYLSQLYTHPQFMEKGAKHVTSIFRENLLQKCDDLLTYQSMKRYISSINRKAASGQPVGFVDMLGHFLGDLFLTHPKTAKLTDQSRVIDEGLNPFPIYSCISLTDGYKSTNVYADIVEISPYKVAMPNFGVYMKTELFGSKFYIGHVLRKYPEFPLHYYLGLWSSIYVFCFLNIINTNDRTKKHHLFEMKQMELLRNNFLNKVAVLDTNAFFTELMEYPVLSERSEQKLLVETQSSEEITTIADATSEISAEIEKAAIEDLPMNVQLAEAIIDTEPEISEIKEITEVAEKELEDSKSKDLKKLKNKESKELKNKETDDSKNKETKKFKNKELKKVKNIESEDSSSKESKKVKNKELKKVKNIESEESNSKVSKKLKNIDWKILKNKDSKDVKNKESGELKNKESGELKDKDTKEIGNKKMNIFRKILDTTKVESEEPLKRETEDRELQDIVNKAAKESRNRQLKGRRRRKAKIAEKKESEGAENKNLQGIEKEKSEEPENKDLEEETDENDESSDSDFEEETKDDDDFNVSIASITQGAMNAPSFNSNIFYDYVLGRPSRKAEIPVVYKESTRKVEGKRASAILREYMTSRVTHVGRYRELIKDIIETNYLLDDDYLEGHESSSSLVSAVTEEWTRDDESFQFADGQELTFTSSNSETKLIQNIKQKKGFLSSKKQASLNMLDIRKRMRLARIRTHKIYWRNVLQNLFMNSEHEFCLRNAALVFNPMRGLNLCQPVSLEHQMVSVYGEGKFAHFDTEQVYRDLKDHMKEKCDCNLGEKTLCLGDQTPVSNMPFPPLLRPQRGVDLILCFDFNSRLADKSSPFEDLCMVEKWAEKNNVPFPPIESKLDDLTLLPLKECYLFDDPLNPHCPTVLFFPIVNNTFKRFKAPEVERTTPEEIEFANFELFSTKSDTYGTFNFHYDELSFDRLFNLMKYNVLSSANKIRDAIHKVTFRKKTARPKPAHPPAFTFNIHEEYRTHPTETT